MTDFERVEKQMKMLEHLISERPEYSEDNMTLCMKIAGLREYQRILLGKETISCRIPR